MIDERRVKRRGKSKGTSGKNPTSSFFLASAFSSTVDIGA
jgi:hypothetical protein